jgi:hypothetical protein
MKTLDINSITADKDQLAVTIGLQYDGWRKSRSKWEEEKQDLRNFVFATDTTKTAAGALPWKNKTTLPKLCQLRDNLQANYMAALFPNDDWFDWEPSGKEDADHEKAEAIKAYIKNKLKQSNFREETARLVYDYIDYGNAFAEVVFEDRRHTLPDGEQISMYRGPRLKRISPLDIVFDLTASSFDDSPKITRTFTTVGTLAKRFTNEPENAAWIRKGWDHFKNFRNNFSGIGHNDRLKAEAYKVDGFGNLLDYYRSNTVEILEFEGDIYDSEHDKLYENHRIIVADRLFVLLMEPYNSWLGTSNKKHTGWRLRPDSLLAMGPLDNLVGVQYRVDHLENLRADVFDQIATPVVYQKGYIEAWKWGPNEKIFGDTESDLQILRPDATALQADFQIDRYLALMEEMAGAPKQAMGIRTPGEKTAFEVQTLENASGRIFQNKVQHFEQTFLEPLLNQMLEAARRNMNEPEVARAFDTDLGVEEFLTIQPEDIKAKGKLAPMGARHFARKAQMMQNLMGFVNSGLYQDPLVNTHVSGKVLAEMASELLGFEQYDLVRPNVRVTEQKELASMTQTAQDQTVMEGVQSPDTDTIPPDQQAALEEG